jgi:hypothetical protein
VLTTTRHIHIDTDLTATLNYDQVLMTKQLLILFFVASVGVNSLAAVNPHTPSDGGCSVACCEAARQRRPNSIASRLCCMVDCNQPGRTTSSSTATDLVASLKKHDAAAHLRALHSLELETDLTVRRFRFPSSPTRNIAGSSDRYLETGTLLI